MCGDRAIVDYASAARVLVLHDSEGFLRTEKSACQVNLDHRPPLVPGKIFQRDAWCADTCVVEQQVEPTECVPSLGKEVLDRGRVGHISRNDQRARARGCICGSRGSVQWFLSASGESDTVALGEQG